MKTNIIKGDDAQLVFTIKNQAGNAIDLTGATAMTFKAAASLSAAASISKTLGAGIVNTTPASGIVTVTLTDSDTDLEAGVYYFELQITDASGNIMTVRDIDENPGEITILDDLD